MREVLFRAKDKDCGKWIEGFPVRIYDYGGLVWDMHPFNTNFEITRSVDPKTIGQFTGLTDKNGKKIFEGDILEYTSYTGTGIKEVKRAVVFWDEHRWSYKVIYNNRWTAQWNNNGYTCDIYKEVVAKYGEVIGNIHDNPELLENP